MPMMFYTQILELTAPDTTGLGGSLGSTIDWPHTDTGLLAGAMGLLTRSGMRMGNGFRFRRGWHGGEIHVPLGRSAGGCHCH